jgi:hypothetical protein
MRLKVQVPKSMKAELYKSALSAGVLASYRLS